MQIMQIMQIMHTVRAANLPTVQTKETMAALTENPTKILLKMNQRINLPTIIPAKTVMLQTITAADIKEKSGAGAFLHPLFCVLGKNSDFPVI